MSALSLLPGHVMVAAYQPRLTYLLVGDGLLRRLVQLLDRLGVKPQILLAANKDDGQTRAEVQNLGDPLSTQRVSAYNHESATRGVMMLSYLLLYVVKRVWRVDGEADEDDVGVWV
jgi:hypothetical protein